MLVDPVHSLFNLPIKRSCFVAIVGIPFDSTQLVFTGSRLAPLAIRLASKTLNEFSLLHRADIRSFSISDWGDLDVVFGDFKMTKERLHKALKGVEAEKFFFFGGDHSITIMTIDFFKENVRKYVHLDADADFQSKKFEEKFGHETVLRRVGEAIGYENVVLIGYRTTTEDELRELEREGIEAYSSYEILEDENVLRKHLREADYISLDLDVFDPAYAPEVGTPEPFGLDPKILLEELTKIKAKYFDIVELVTTNINSRTAILAAAIAREVLISMAKFKT